jgi:hypothetical protein
MTGFLSMKIMPRYKKAEPKPQPEMCPAEALARSAGVSIDVALKSLMLERQAKADREWFESPVAKLAQSVAGRGVKRIRIKSCKEYTEAQRLYVQAGFYRPVMMWWGVEIVPS